MVRGFFTYTHTPGYNCRCLGIKFSIFTKLDAKAGYWSVHLSGSSKELTTFRTPFELFGRYCFRWLPFGLFITQDAFQEHIDRIIAQCQGCIGINNNIACRIWQHWGGAWWATKVFPPHRQERRADHDAQSANCAVQEKQITFGRLYTDNGVFPDPAKVQDLINMPMPSDKKDMERFLGLATYPGPQAPNLATHAGRFQTSRRLTPHLFGMKIIR